MIGKKRGRGVGPPVGAEVPEDLPGWASLSASLKKGVPNQSWIQMMTHYQTSLPLLQTAIPTTASEVSTLSEQTTAISCSAFNRVTIR